VLLIFVSDRKLKPLTTRPSLFKLPIKLSLAIFVASGSITVLGANDPGCARYVFTHPDGKLWTSQQYYHQEFLYPSLKCQQQAAGDAMVMAFDGTLGNTLE
jgi:hypothetical protein